MHSIVFVTANNREEAERIIQDVLNKKLAACVNVIERVESFYWWQGKINQAQELLLVIKTRKELFARLQEAVKAVHSYDVPEIIAVDISDGNPAYLKWIDDNTRV